MHHIYRVNCFAQTCSKCRKAVFVKTSLLGDRLYVCSPMPKKHKEIDARDCGEFRCSEYGEYLYCQDCSGGAPVKRLRRY